jgi:hypothetical protein
MGAILHFIEVIITKNPLSSNCFTVVATSQRGIIKEQFHCFHHTHTPTRTHTQKYT